MKLLLPPSAATTTLYPQGRKVTQWQINDNLDWIRGKQEFRFGINTRRVDVSDYDLGEGSVPTAVYNDLAEFTYGAAYTESQTFPDLVQRAHSRGQSRPLCDGYL